MLPSEYASSCFMAKSVVTSKQDRHFIVLFCHFIQPSECKYVYVLFVCLSSDCKYLLFRCISDTLARDFLSAQLIYRWKVELCQPLYDFCGKNQNYFLRTLPTVKIKIPENNPHVFKTKPRKFGDATISHYTVYESMTKQICTCNLDQQIGLKNSTDALT